CFGLPLRRVAPSKANTATRKMARIRTRTERRTRTTPRPRNRKNLPCRPIRRQPAHLPPIRCIPTPTEKPIPI
ncbi:MAG: hypothetical protein AVDCRST_MAG56-5710, partial [uncultured Cytophagales bacterium]